MSTETRACVRGCAMYRRHLTADNGRDLADGDSPPDQGDKRNEED